MWILNTITIHYQILNSKYCISSVLIGSLNFGSQLMLRVTLYGHALRPVLAAENCCWKYSNVQNLMKFNKTTFLFALVGYENGYSQLIFNARSWNNCWIYVNIQYGQLLLLHSHLKRTQVIIVYFNLSLTKQSKYKEVRWYSL